MIRKRNENDKKKSSFFCLFEPEKFLFPFCRNSKSKTIKLEAFSILFLHTNHVNKSCSKLFRKCLVAGDWVIYNLRCCRLWFPHIKFSSRTFLALFNPLFNIKSASVKTSNFCDNLIELSFLFSLQLLSKLCML